jgi:hypothetical protein
VSEFRTKVRITGDPAKATCSANGKPYVFPQSVKAGDTVHVNPRCAKDLVKAGVAEKAK